MAAMGEGGVRVVAWLVENRLSDPEREHQVGSISSMALFQNSRSVGDSMTQ